MQRRVRSFRCAVQLSAHHEINSSRYADEIRPPLENGFDLADDRCKLFIRQSTLRCVAIAWAFRESVRRAVDARRAV